MSDEEIDIAALEKRMDGALHALRTEFASLRTGRASASMLDPVMVEAYGSTDAGQPARHHHRARAAHGAGQRLGQERWSTPSTRRSATPASASTRRWTAPSCACRSPS